MSVPSAAHLHLCPLMPLKSCSCWNLYNFCCCRVCTLESPCLCRLDNVVASWKSALLTKYYWFCVMCASVWHICIACPCLFISLPGVGHCSSAFWFPLTSCPLLFFWRSSHMMPWPFHCHSKIRHMLCLWPNDFKSCLEYVTQVDVDYDDITSTEERKAEFRQRMKSSLVQNICADNVVNPSRLKGQGARCRDSIQVSCAHTLGSCQWLTFFFCAAC